MAKRKFEMHEYRQIIVRLKLGESIRSIVMSRVACRKKVRQVRKVALAQQWLEAKNELPDDVLAKHFKSFMPTPVTQSSVLPYQEQLYSELGLKVNRIFFGSRVEKHISDGIAKTLTNRNINFHYLRAPISNNDQQRVIICDDWIRATGRNCHIKCDLNN